MHHLLCKVVNFVTALGSIYLGGLALGHDVFALSGMSDLAQIFMYIFGVAGVVGLILLFTSKDKCERFQR